MATLVLAGRAILTPLLLLCGSFGAAEVSGNNDITFEPNADLKYDTQPKLHLKGSGFDHVSAEDLQLEFMPDILEGGVLSKVVVKADHAIDLELTPGKRWISSDGDQMGRPLLLTSAVWNEKPQLDSPLTVATILPTPSVYPSTNIVYLTTSPRLMVNGTNFNEKHTHLFFSPPLADGVDVSILVTSSTVIWVTLVQKTTGKKWGDEPGPLKIVAIDTGGGRLPLREDLGGVTIAEMQADLKGHGITVETHEEINMYQSTKVLTVAGEGFNPGNTKFRFANSLNVEKHYTVDVTDSAAVFSLVEGSKWIANLALLPGPLVLLAANAGDGYVPLGSTNARSGRRVATVYEDPSLKESYTEVHRTQTHELGITGAGFTKKFPPIFTFEPPIDHGDVVLNVVNRTHLKVSLAGEAKGWMPDEETGTLFVRAINTGAGMFQFEEPVPVALVVSDSDRHNSGIWVEPNYLTQRYQSSTEPLVIIGEKFPLDTEAELTFGYGGPEQEGFTCRTLSETALEVSLVDGYMWTDQGGPLFLVGLTFGEHELSFKSPGLKVATILDDPFVEASQLHVYASHTKHITIKGHGFLSAFDPYTKPKVLLSPTLGEDYVINSGDWTDSAVTLSLVPGRSGEASQWADVQTEEETVAIKVVSIDTGGGVVAMAGGGIVVAQVRMDDATFSCDDSCIYANDGLCDENQGGEKNKKWNGDHSTNSDVSLTSQASNSRPSFGYLGYSTMVASTDDLPITDIPSCPIGTDCTDCGLQMVDAGKCSNTCRYARDGTCDDRRSSGVCPDGTDCQDCGPWDHSNFTRVDGSMSEISSEAYNDDDSGFLANDPDHPMFLGQTNNGVGQYKRVFVEHRVVRKESENAESVFMKTLWAAIVLVGGSVTVYLTILVVRYVKGQSISLPIPTNPDVEGRR